MDKDLYELNVIRLDTELENAIGHRDYYLKKDNYKLYAVWDQEVENVLEEIRKLGAYHE
jgi:hypothetical protein